MICNVGSRKESQPSLTEKCDLATLVSIIAGTTPLTKVGVGELAYQTPYQGKDLSEITAALKAKSDKDPNFKKNPEYQNLKLRLPAVRIAGDFSKGWTKDQVVSFSGLCAIDIDELGNYTADELKQALVYEGIAVVAFTSPSGNVKAFAQLDIDTDLTIDQYDKEYKAKVQNIFDDVEYLFDLKCDTKCTDLARATFLIVDPTVVVAKELITYTPKFSKEVYTKDDVSIKTYAKADMEMVDRYSNLFEYLLANSTNYQFINNSDFWSTMMFACANDCGMSGYEAFDKFSQCLDGYDSNVDTSLFVTERITVNEYH